MFSSVRRSIAAIVLSTGLVLAAASCSDSEPGSSSNTVTIKPSSYVVRDPVTTSSAPVDTAPTADGRSPVEQAYTVQPEDNPSQIASLFDVDVDELRNYNGWASDYSDFPAVDGIVRIPPNALFIDPNATTTAPEEEEPTEASDTTAEREEGDCAPGTYTVEDGDNPSTIAAKFDVTLEALTAANGWDAEYSNFQGTGEDVTIPAPEDCDTTATT